MINFTLSAEKIRIIVFRVLCGLSVILAVFTVVMVLHIPSVKLKKAELSEVLAGERLKYENIPGAKMAPGESESLALRKRAAEINRLQGIRAAGAGNILGVIEKNTPKEISLSLFYYEPENRLIRITANCLSAKDISWYMKNLEKQPVFSAVVLEKQNVLTKPGAPAVAEFTLRLTEAQK